MSHSAKPALWLESEQTRPLAFFDDVLQGFDSAVQHAGRIDRHYRLGGYTVRLCFAGDALLLKLAAALAHLRIAPSVPDLTICAWDTVSTKVALPPTPWQAHYAVRGEIEGYNTDRIYAAFEHESYGISMLDTARNVGVLWVHDPQRIPYWVKGSPLRILFHWWLGLHGRQLVHSAAVGTSTGGVLITGKSGSGKSTTALTCLESGMLYAGDDYVIVRADPQPYVFGLYNTAKLVSDRLGDFQRLAKLVDNPSRPQLDKALVFINGSHESQLSAGFLLKAILVPKVTGLRETTIRRTSAAAALAALAPTTIFAHPRGGQMEFRFLSGLVRRLPCYLIECGTELNQIPAVIGGLVAKDDNAQQ